MEDGTYLMLVSDEPDAMKLPMLALEREGYSVRRVCPRDFAPGLIGDPVSLVIVDASGPHTNALEVRAALQAHPDTADVPVVVLVDSGDEATRRALSGTRTADVLVSPFPSQGLLERVRMVLAPEQEIARPRASTTGAFHRNLLSATGHYMHHDDHARPAETQATDRNTQPQDQGAAGADTSFLSGPDSFSARLYANSLRCNGRNGSGNSSLGKILIVDDHAHVRELLKVTLEVGPYTLLTASNGSEALASARAEKPEIMFLDVSLNGSLSGLEVCRALKSDPQTQSIHIIMVTAHGQDSDRERGLAAGADDYFVKPFSPIRLIEVVEAILG